MKYRKRFKSLQNLETKTFTNLHDAEKSYFEQEFYISQIKEGIKHKLQ